MTKIEIAIEYMRRHEGVTPYAAATFAGCNPGSLYKKLNGETPQRKKRRNATQMVLWAIRAGTIAKDVCFICGEAKTQGHHADYDEPLSVTWLCVPHHYEVHSRGGARQPIDYELPPRPAKLRGLVRLEADEQGK